jgi:hypothetical protein
MDRIVRPHARSSRSELWQWQRMQSTSRVYVYNCTYILWLAAGTISLCVFHDECRCVPHVVKSQQLEQVETTIKMNLRNRAKMLIYMFIYIGM